MKLIVSLSALALLSTGACVVHHEDRQVVTTGGGNPTPVTLTVEQEATIDFDDMAKGIAEIAAFASEDLRDQPTYSDLRSRLRCAALDLPDSWVRITDLSGGPQSPVPLLLQIDVSPRGATAGHDGVLGTVDDDASQWVLLGELNAAVTEGETLALDDAKWDVMAGGLRVLTDAVMATTPVYDVRITGEIDDPVANLMVDLHFALNFSSLEGDCPTP